MVAQEQSKDRDILCSRYSNSQEALRDDYQWISYEMWGIRNIESRCDVWGEKSHLEKMMTFVFFCLRKWKKGVIYWDEK